ncbi:hypothetical protein DUNSADRAFT_6524 [Dunaliella salina]|uniref:Uncharacterized protein n=1 Tax=Dunaliella salina TaxID=3046 RepID=A0ABQ7GN67_DUNSA|nr:hypothetical protein DUNSADRAFT_6524 [Dunaliella salina]|eukprot:KAF5836054.1 hypothetical protein DUNSADRAFT_6524 [Dunaliella salina]
MSAQPQPSPLFDDPSTGPHCPDLATCVHAVYAGDTLKRVLALALCKRTRNQPPLGPYTCVGPEIGILLQKNPEAAPLYGALGTPKLRKLLEAKVPAAEGNRPALAPDDGILHSVPFHGNQAVRLNVAALQEAYLKLCTPGGKQHTANATSSTAFGSTTATSTTNMSIASIPALPAAAAAASLNASDTRGLAVCMACLSVWAKTDSGGVYGFGSQAGVALATLAVTIVSQPPHHAASNGGTNRYQLRHASRVIERTLNMLSAEGWGGAGPVGGQPKAPSVGPQLVSQVLQQGAPWLQVLDRKGLPMDLDALAIANVFAESGLFVELQVCFGESATGRLVPKPKPPAPSTSAAGWPPQLGLAPAQKLLKFLQQYIVKARTRLRIVLTQLLEEARLVQQQQQQQQQAKVSRQEQAGIGSDGGALSPHAHVLALCLEQLKTIATTSHNGVPPPQMGVVNSSGSDSSSRISSGRPDDDGGVTLLQHAPHASASKERPYTQRGPTGQGLLNGRAVSHGAAPTSTAAAAAAGAAGAAAAEGDFVCSTADGDAGTDLHDARPFEGPQHADSLGSEAMAQQQHWEGAFSPTPQRARAALEARLAAQAGGHLAGMPMPQPVHGVHGVHMPQLSHGGHGMVAPSAAAHGEHAGQAQQQQQQQQVQLGVLDWGALDDAVDSGASGANHHGGASGWSLDNKIVQEAAHSRAHDAPPSLLPQQSHLSGPPPHGGTAQPYPNFHHYDDLYAQQQRHLEQQMLGIDPTSASTLLPTCWQQQEEQGTHGWDAARTGAVVPDSAGSDAHRLYPTGADLVSNEGIFLAGKPSAQQQQQQLLQQQQSGVAEGGAGGEEDEGVDDDDLLALLVGGGVE